MSTSSIEAHLRPAFMARAFYVFLALAILSALISVAGKWVGRSIALAGHTESTAIHEVVIGNNVIAVPANMIRFEAARQSGLAPRLDLYIRWPDLQGYSAATRDDFNHVGGSRNILFVSFQRRLMSQDMSGRFNPIYTHIVEAEATPGPAGLRMHAFSTNSGFLDEVLAVGWREGTERPFVARCLRGEQARLSLAPCERDLHVGDGLSLSYRFPDSLLSDWAQLDAILLQAVSGMIQSAD
jgi:hypothetical protein